jgi:hypothetical protein
MQDYLFVENLVVQRLIAHFPDELSESRCKAGKVDQVLEAVFKENANYGCVVDFGGGSDDLDKAFARPQWTWRLVGVFLIRLAAGEDSEDPTEQIEINLRRIIDKLPHLFGSPGQETLDRQVGFVRVVSVDVPELGDVNDVPFYFLPFTVTVIDR